MSIGWENIKMGYLQAGGLLLARRTQRLRRAGDWQKKLDTWFLEFQLQGRMMQNLLNGGR